MFRFSIFLFGAVLTFLVMTNQALACRCAKPDELSSQAAYDEADVVAKVDILSMSQGFRAMGPLAKLKIINLYKGRDIPDIITANVNTHLEACGNMFEEGQEVIVALYDTRSLMITDTNMRGYGFRTMISCYQDQVKYYIEQKDKD